LTLESKNNASRSTKYAFVAVFLVLLGGTVSVYSYGQLQNKVVLFDRSAIQPDRLSYISYDTNPVDLNGKYAAIVTGGVGGPGCCVDFYLVNDTSWNSWSSNTTSRSALAMVHLNSSDVSSQAQSGQFSFVPPSSAGYQVVFMNDNYPDANNATINANITLRYDSVNASYGVVAGLAVLSSGLALAIIFIARRARAPTLPER
jgi:hypothetical protein